MSFNFNMNRKRIFLQFLRIQNLTLSNLPILLIDNPDDKILSKYKSTEKDGKWKKLIP